MLSDVVAEQVLTLRKRAGLTHRSLAARCEQIGYPALTAGAISNIERGRRDDEGRRTRAVTVDELAVLARALDVPPALLVAPLGDRDDVEVWPGRTWDTLRAYRWFAGLVTVSDGHPDSDPRPLTGLAPAVIRTYQAHADAVWELHAAQTKKKDESRVERAWEQLRAVQSTMRESGWRIPPLDDLTAEDDDDEARARSAGDDGPGEAQP